MSENAIETPAVEPVSGVQEATQEVLGTIEPQTNPEIKKNIFQTIVDGEEMSFDLDDPTQKEKLRSLVQKESASQKRMREAADREKVAQEKEKELLEIFAMVQKNPRAYLKNIGIDENEFAASILDEYLKEAEKSPEMKAQEDKDKRLKEFEEENTRLKREKEEIESAKQTEKLMNEIDKEITDALTKHTDIPRTKYTVGRIASYLKDALDNGYYDVTVDDVIPFVRKRFHEEAKEIIRSFGANGVDGLENFLGEDMVSALRKAKKVKAQEEVQKNLSTKVQDTAKKAPETSNKQAKMSLNQWLRNK